MTDETPILRPRMTLTEIEADPRLKWVDFYDERALEQAANEIAKECLRSNRGAVWVEGFKGAGKSGLTRQLLQALRWRVVNLDTLITEKYAEPLAYCSMINTERLQDELGSDEKRQRVVIEGVCLRDVLGEWADRRTAYIVYVARVTERPRGITWHDGLHIEDSEAADRVSELDANTLTGSVDEYHLRVRPHLDADTIVLRPHDSFRSPPRAPR